MWLDKTKIKLFDNNYNDKVLREQVFAYYRNNIHYMKHGEGGIMVWGCFLCLVLENSM